MPLRFSRKESYNPFKTVITPDYKIEKDDSGSLLDSSSFSRDFGDLTKSVIKQQRSFDVPDQKKRKPQRTKSQNQIRLKAKQEDQNIGHMKVPKESKRDNVSFGMQTAERKNEAHEEENLSFGDKDG